MNEILLLCLCYDMVIKFMTLIYILIWYYWFSYGQLDQAILVIGYYCHMDLLEGNSIVFSHSILIVYILMTDILSDYIHIYIFHTLMAIWFWFGSVIFYILFEVFIIIFITNCLEITFSVRLRCLIDWLTDKTVKLIKSYKN